MSRTFVHVTLDFTYLHCRYSVSNRSSREDEDRCAYLFRNTESHARHSISFFWTGWHQKWKGGKLRVITCILLYHTVVDTNIVNSIDDQRSCYSTVGNGEQ